MIKATSATIPFFVYNPLDGSGSTGLSAAITVRISKDGGPLVVCTNTPTELNAALAPGRYSILLTDSEMNADSIRLIITHTTSKASDVIITTEQSPTDVSANAIATALLDTVLTTHTTEATVGKKLLDIPTATYTVPSDYASTTDVTDITTKIDAIDALIDAIKLKTDALPNEVAAIGDEMSLDSTTVTSIRASLATAQSIADLATALSAITTNTSRIPQSPASTSDIPTASDITTAVLSTNATSVEDSAAKYSLCSLIYAALHSSINGSAWTLKKEDGSQYLILEVTPTAGAQPITAIE